MDLLLYDLSIVSMVITPFLTLTVSCIAMRNVSFQVQAKIIITNLNKLQLIKFRKMRTETETDRELICDSLNDWHSILLIIQAGAIIPALMIIITATTWFHWFYFALNVSLFMSQLEQMFMRNPQEGRHWDRTYMSGDLRTTRYVWHMGNCMLYAFVYGACFIGSCFV